MKQLRWFVLPMLVLAAEAALSAQILGGDPITAAARRAESIIVLAVQLLGIVAIGMFGLRWMTGHGETSNIAGMIFGGALAFGAPAAAAAFFGVTP